MESRYKRKRFNKEELEWAINLIEKEFPIKERNTPIKMSSLISENFDVLCDPNDIEVFFGINENYELENLKIFYNNGN